MFSSLLPKIATFLTLSFVLVTFVPTINLEAKGKKSVKKITTTYRTKASKNSVKTNSQNQSSNSTNAINNPPYNPLLATIVKKSKNNICHDLGSRSYSKTKIFTSFSSLENCLNSGGKLPLK